MPIITVSLNERMLTQLDKLQKELGFSGRSEAIRAGARLLIAENKENEKITGKTTAILLLIHSQKAEDAANSISHQFSDIIKTQIHNTLKDDKCLEIFILEGEAQRIKKLAQAAQTQKKIEYNKLLLP